MTPGQALSLSAALADAETVLRIFADHAPPPELVFARYHAEQVQRHLTELLESLPDSEHTKVARYLDRLRRAGSGHAIPLDVTPLVARRTLPTQPNNGGSTS